ncbi:Vertebrate ancient opsin [Dissostichus eleginoides]|uniref:Vertebrate ancient opsin n=1 Tax=Dissostichus eleginoides TaxID=100907 RepID=A0AAD9B8R4_DISEL|nr:Vertebrate ancient opsin [Dissostichus eleginoides]
MGMKDSPMDHKDFETNSQQDERAEGSAETLSCRLLLLCHCNEIKKGHREKQRDKSFVIMLCYPALLLSSRDTAGIVSLISLAVLSYERYSTMVAPTEADASNYRKISQGILLSWLYSLAWTLPPLFGWSKYGPEGPGTTCSVDWTAKTANSISYIICLFVFCLIAPFLVIVFCYGKLLCAIRQVQIKTVNKFVETTEAM